MRGSVFVIYCSILLKPLGKVNQKRLCELYKKQPAISVTNIAGYPIYFSNATLSAIQPTLLWLMRAEIVRILFFVAVSAARVEPSSVQPV